MDNPEKFQFLKKVSENLEKPGENIEKIFKSGKIQGIDFWATLDSQYSCSKMGVATKGVAVNACSSRKSSQLSLPLWSGKN